MPEITIALIDSEDFQQDFFAKLKAEKPLSYAIESESSDAISFRRAESTSILVFSKNRSAEII
jgi:hypothetical protein